MNNNEAMLLNCHMGDSICGYLRPQLDGPDNEKRKERSPHNPGGVSLAYSEGVYPM